MNKSLNTPDADGNKIGLANIANKHVNETTFFKLNTDCSDEIFEYSCIKDLHSFGQTCKTLQKVAGEYFKTNHCAAENFSGSDGIYTMYSNHDTTNERTQISCFNQFMINISHHGNEKEPLEYIQKHLGEFINLEQIYLSNMNITEADAKILKAVLAGIKVLKIHKCSITDDFDNIDDIDDIDE